MSLKLKIGAAALGVLAASLTAQTAFAAGAGGASGASGPRPAGAFAVRCGVAKVLPRHQVIHRQCCPDVAVVYRVTSHPAPKTSKAVTLVTAFCCPAPGPVVPVPVALKPVKGQPVARFVVYAGCAAQVVVFDAAADGSVFTEVRGPRLVGHETIFYRGRIYQVASVSGKRFTLNYRGMPYRNEGPAIRDGRAVVLPYFIVRIAPAPCK